MEKETGVYWPSIWRRPRYWIWKVISYWEWVGSLRTCVRICWWGLPMGILSDTDASYGRRRQRRVPLRLVSTSGGFWLGCIGKCTLFCDSALLSGYARPALRGLGYWLHVASGIYGFRCHGTLQALLMNIAQKNPLMPWKNRWFLPQSIIGIWAPLTKILPKSYQNLTTSLPGPLYFTYLQSQQSSAMRSVHPSGRCRQPAL